MTRMTLCSDCKSEPRVFGSYCRACHRRRSLASRAKYAVCSWCKTGRREQQKSYCRECLNTINRIIGQRQRDEAGIERRDIVSLPPEVLESMILCEQKRIEAEERLLLDTGHDLDEISAYEADRYLCEATA